MMKNRQQHLQRKKRQRHERQRQQHQNLKLTTVLFLTKTAAAASFLVLIIFHGMVIASVNGFVSDNTAAGEEDSLTKAATVQEASNLLESIWESLKHGLSNTDKTRRNQDGNHGSSSGGDGSGSSKRPSSGSGHHHEPPRANRRRALLIQALRNHYSRQLLSSSLSFDEGKGNDENDYVGDGSERVLLNQTVADNIGETLHAYLYAGGGFCEENSRIHDRTASLRTSLPPFPPSARKANLKLIREMFAHAYDSYMLHAYPYGEIKPFSCEPGKFDLVRLPALTLIDSLGSLLVLGNTTEFARSVERLRLLNEQSEKESGEGIFGVDQNVSVFETNIRVLGGLLSAHQMAVAFMSGKVTESQVWSKDKTSILWEHNSSAGANSHSQDSQNGDTDTCSADVVDLDKNDSNQMEDGGDGDSDSNNGLRDSASDLFCHSDLDDCVSRLVSEAESDKKQNNTKNMKYWVYDGFLLQLAHDIGLRLLPAFESKTGIPYGTVNLLSGVPNGETTVASLAGGGTLSLEFELLSRLTGDDSFGKAAKLAARAIWMRRSSLNLLGKHIDIQSGSWTETLSGVGSNSDSFFEYLAKHFMLFPEDSDFWYMLLAAYSGLHKDARLGEWYMDVDMSVGLRMGTNGGRRVFESLMAFYPGMQTLLGEIVPAAKSLNSFFMLREFLGFLPERFDYGSWKTVNEASSKHPLRPELLESCYYLHRATKKVNGKRKNTADNDNESENETSGWLWASDFALHALQNVARAKCGYATIRDVSSTTTGTIGASSKTKGIRFVDDMPSFFLSETLKYLYLTFDENNMLHQDDDRAWIFTTEAHPIHHVPTTNEESRNQRLERIKLAVQQRLRTDIVNYNANNEINDNDNNYGAQMHEEHMAPSRLGLEKWTSDTTMNAYIQDVRSVIDDITKRRREKAMKNQKKGKLNVSNVAEFFGNSELIVHLDGNIVGNDFFGEIQNGGNIAHLTLKSSGLGDGVYLKKACPNFHAPELFWLRALNGGIYDYTDAYVSSTSDNPSEHIRPSEFVLFGAADALGFYGSGLHFGERRVGVAKGQEGGGEIDEKCFIQSRTIENASSLSSNENSDIQGTAGTSSPKRGERVDMGADLGIFEIFAFSEGSGFFMEHVDSGESVMATFIVDDNGVNDGQPKVYIMTYATTKSKADNHTENQTDGIANILHEDRFESSPWRPIGPGWASLHMTKTTKQNPSNSDDQPGTSNDDSPPGSPPSPEVPERAVVMADFDGNSFICEIKIIKRPLVMFTNNDDSAHGGNAAVTDEVDIDEVSGTDGHDDLYHDETSAEKDTLEEEDIILAQYPCASALFGPTHMSQLLETNGVQVELEVHRPDENDEFGCHGEVMDPAGKVYGDFTPSIVKNMDGAQNDDDDEFDFDFDSDGKLREGTGADSDADPVDEEVHVEGHELDDERRMGPPIIQIVHRGMCTFRSKAVQQLKNLHAEGVIVINNEDEELFVMSHGREENDASEEVPVTVLVSGLDGKDMIRVLKIEEEDIEVKGNDYHHQLLAQISLLPQEGSIDDSGNVVHGAGGTTDWPLVKGSSEALQIFSEGGWGIHAVPRNKKQQQKSTHSFDWQLFLLRHSV